MYFLLYIQSLGMNPNDFGDLLTFPVVAPTGQTGKAFE